MSNLLSIYDVFLAIKQGKTIEKALIQLSGGSYE